MTIVIYDRHIFIVYSTRQMVISYNRIKGSMLDIYSFGNPGSCGNAAMNKD